MYKSQIVNYKQYLNVKSDHLIEAVVKHDRGRNKYSIIKEAQEIKIELNLTHKDTHSKKEIKDAILKKQNESWRNKQLHGQFPKKVLDQANVDRERSFRWMKKQQVSPSIESSVFAIQDQAIMTRQHQRDILKEPVDGKCRLCASKDETTQHIISGCEKLAGNYYVKRHNNLVQYVYWCLAKKHKIEVSDLWWKEALTQPQIKENESAKILWEMPIQTDVTVTHNRPDIIYIDKKNNKTFLIDITVPSDYNIGPKEIEKLSKYHLLKTEVSEIIMVMFIILLAICIVLVFIKKNRDYWNKRGIMQIDSNAWHFMVGKCALSEVYKNIYDAHPTQNCIGTFVGYKPVLILKNLDDIQAVLQGDFQSFYGRGYKTNPKDTLADNLLLIDDYARWRLVRQKISPIFTASKLRNMFATVDRCASDFVEFIESNQHAKENVFEALRTYISASISASVFGINSTSQNTMINPILDIGWNSTESVIVFNIKFAVSNIFPKLFNLLNLTTFGEHKDFIVGLMKKVLSSRRCMTAKRHDFIDACLELQKQGMMEDSLTGFKLDATDELLAAQAFSFFVAGVDTSTNMINFTLLELSNNPVILKRLHNEIDRIFEYCNDKVTYEDIQKLEYLEMVINESMRKYPPIGLMQRMCMKDTVLPSGNLKIEKDMIVIVPIYGIHRDDKYFNKPDVFDPERFSTENISKINKLSYIPFGEGNRICIGARFAHLQIKTVLAWLLRKYTMKGYNYTSESFEPNFFGIRDSKARYDLVARNEVDDSRPIGINNIPARADDDFGDSDADISRTRQTNRPKANDGGP
ncbi:cytochrome P450 6B5-like [Pararge aegeria]|uniref:cytochrome P450 6B5-like n=1 Tax=Pararge aegeria TaxID=116150 RepID=UPI0019D1DFBE|nr:cytochrome P450 6B5-like [Pararge aegeria]